MTKQQEFIGKKVRYIDDGLIGTITAVIYDQRGERFTIYTEEFGFCDESRYDIEFIRGEE